jgi:hypothetical protein
VLALPLVAQAQKKVSPDDLEGEWKLIFSLEEQAEDAETAFERLALKAVGGLMDEIDIRLRFESEGVFYTSVGVFGEAEEDTDDEAEWSITRHGGLVLGDSDHFSSDDDTVFYFVEGSLVGFELNKDGKPGERKEISLERLDT